MFSHHKLACPADLISLGMIIWIIFSEEYNLWSSTFYAVSSSFLLFHPPWVRDPYLHIWDQVSHPYNVKYIPQSPLHGSSSGWGWRKGSLDMKSGYNCRQATRGRPALSRRAWGLKLFTVKRQQLVTKC
jgi:hypothetical protein